VQSVEVTDKADAGDVEKEEDSEAIKTDSVDEPDVSVTPTQEATPTPEAEPTDVPDDNNIVEEIPMDEPIAQTGDSIGWVVDENNNYKYYQDGVPVTGVRTIDANTYYLIIPVYFVQAFIPSVLRYVILTKMVVHQRMGWDKEQPAGSLLIAAVLSMRAQMEAY